MQRGVPPATGNVSSLSAAATVNCVPPAGDPEPGVLACVRSGPGGAFQSAEVLDTATALR
jgi:hypothetical protein